MRDTFGDVAEFFVVYIREAHAADSSWPMAIPGEDAIYEPKTLAQRRKVASKCVTKLNIELPCLVDDIENSVDKAYHAKPDRIFLVDEYGKLVVRADPGPWGFQQGVDDAKAWLEKQFPNVASASDRQEDHEEVMGTR